MIERWTERRSHSTSVAALLVSRNFTPKDQWLPPLVRISCWDDVILVASSTSLMHADARISRGWSSNWSMSRTLPAPAEKLNTWCVVRRGPSQRIGRVDHDGFRDVGDKVGG